MSDDTTTLHPIPTTQPQPVAAWLVVTAASTPGTVGRSFKNQRRGVHRRPEPRGPGPAHGGGRLAEARPHPPERGRQVRARESRLDQRHLPQRHPARRPGTPGRGRPGPARRPVQPPLHLQGELGRGREPARGARRRARRHLQPRSAKPNHQLERDRGARGGSAGGHPVPLRPADDGLRPRRRPGAGPGRGGGRGPGPAAARRRVPLHPPRASRARSGWRPRAT